MTKKTQTNNAAEIFVPLNKLKKSPYNVRKVPHNAAEIEALAASIAANGMLQNIVVEPERDGEGAESGNYLVTIGEGRRLAQLLRATRKQIKKTELIRCILDTANDAHEISLAENVVRSHMHPADEYEAFALLHTEKGMAAEDIAVRFGVGARLVRQRLKLGAVSPALMALYREDEMTLEQLTAFTITEDHARQEGVWEAIGRDDSPYAIRRALTEGLVATNDRRVRCVGITAYIDAGGVLARDLFDDEDGGYVTDAALLDRLVMQKLEQEAERVRGEGWAWVTVAAEFDHALTSGLRRFYPDEPDIAEDVQQQIDDLGVAYDELSALAENEGVTEDIETRLAELEAQIETLKGEPVFAPDVVAKGGAFVSLGYDGHLRIERGFVRVSDEPSLTANGHAKSPSDKTAPKLSDKLVAALTAQRTAALREAVAAQPATAFVAVVHALVAGAFYTASNISCVGIVGRGMGLASHAPGIDESPLGRACSDRHDALAASLPDDVEMLWDALLALTHEQLMALLAHCAALTIDGVVRIGHGSSSHMKHAEKLAEAVSLDMRAHWQPTADTYLGHVSKTFVLEAVSEGVSPQAASRLEGLKKPEMVTAAEGLLANSGWLPSPLRMPSETQQVTAAD